MFFFDLKSRTLIKKTPRGWLVFIIRGRNPEMIASFLNCFLKGINKKSNWPTLNFPTLETDPSFYFINLGGFSNRGKGFCWVPHTSIHIACCKARPVAAAWSLQCTQEDPRHQSPNISTFWTQSDQQTAPETTMTSAFWASLEELQRTNPVTLRAVSF